MNVIEKDIDPQTGLPVEKPIGYDQYIESVTGFAEYFPPLNEEESSEAMRFMDTFDEQDRIDKPITWCESLGMKDAPHDPRVRISLIELAVELGRMDVLQRAAKEDPHNEVRRTAIQNMG
jgi:hypothetical protein